MDVTPQALEAAYTFLRTVYKPFQRLPPAEEVEFHTTLHRDRYGDWMQWQGGHDDAHIIRISETNIEHALTLLAIVAHEMIHALQVVTKTARAGVEHNADFNRRKRACAKFFGWDGKAF